MTQPEQPTVLSVRNLTTHFFTDAGVARAVDDVSFDVKAGRTLALVGESGCGKSVTALSVLRLIPEPPGRIVSGQILLDGNDLLELKPKDMRKVRGNAISMIFQEPMTSLNPVFRVGSQISAAIMLHQRAGRDEARKQTIALLDKVGIPCPEQRIDDYPHQMSGGMRQRVMIAMALACNPRLLIADEPTTALDVTIQAQVLELLCELRTQTGMAVLLITHDLGIVAEAAHDVAIMYAGKIVEQAPVAALFDCRAHPYTVGLFDSLPQLGKARQRLKAIFGQVPAATNFPPGCRFHPRCPHALGVCQTQEPPLLETENGHAVACWLHHEPTMAAANRQPGLPEREEIRP